MSVTTLKNQLSKYLRLVKRGETIEVMEHSVPIARIQGLGEGATGEEHLDRLVRDGLVTKARDEQAGRRTLKEPPIPCSGDAVNALVESRGDR